VNSDEELCYWCMHKNTIEKEITESLRKILSVS
jgi:succinate dehydrogenase flavin-adding protein (antitoxin of CptAB toxin-antitoxin module)